MNEFGGRRDGESPADAAAHRMAAERGPGTLGEFWAFLRQTGKWWLAPALVALLLVGLLAVLAGSGAAPFVYALF